MSFGPFQSSTELLRAVQGGDARAAHTLACRAVTIGLKTARPIVRDRDRAEDIAQDVAIDVIQGVVRLRDAGSLDSWIRRIAIRTTIREVRRARARRDREVSLDQVPLAALHAFLGSPELELERRGDAERVRRALRELSVKQRLALLLRYSEDLTQRQVADVMCVRPGTAAALLSRGRSNLRRRCFTYDFAILPT